MNEVTLVTALYNINRESIDGREWDEYLRWFDMTLKLKCPMHIFISEDVREFVEERRLKIPTEIRVTEVEEIPYYYLKPKIDNIISSEQYTEIIDCPERIECRESMYSIIQYSKFLWLQKAARDNSFGSDFYFWIDAGASRFFEDFDLNSEFPSKDAIETLQEMDEKILIQLNTEFYKDLATATFLDDSYLLDSRAITCGSFFGGHRNMITPLFEAVNEILKNKMIKKGFINNEQIALAYLLKNNPETFVQYERINGQHMDIFRELS